MDVCVIKVNQVPSSGIKNEKMLSPKAPLEDVGVCCPCSTSVPRGLNDSMAKAVYLDIVLSFWDTFALYITPVSKTNQICTFDVTFRGQFDKGLDMKSSLPSEMKATCNNGTGHQKFTPRCRSF